MFRDLKEYQEIAKIYTDKVSKPEDLDERVRGGGVSGAMPSKKFTPTPQGGYGGGTGNPTNRRGMGAKPRPKPEIKKFPSTAEIRAGSDRVGGGNAGASTDSGGTQGQGGAPEIKKPDPKPQSKFIRRERGKGPGFYKRGTVTARRAENQEKAKLRAQAMAKARIEAKKKAEMSESVDLTPYDIVLEYLLSSKQASTIEEANYIMTEMDAETIQSIVSD